MVGLITKAPPGGPSSAFVIRLSLRWRYPDQVSAVDSVYTALSTGGMPAPARPLTI